MKTVFVVVMVEQDNNKVRVTLLKAGVQQQLDADRVIVVAIPFSVLRKIELENSFSHRGEKPDCFGSYRM
jgi:monoamine oxidase